MDGYVRLAGELVRAVRGARSQTAFNRRLGYSTNVAHGWERGRRAPSAARFFEVAAEFGVDVVSGLCEFLREDSGRLRAAESTAQVVVGLLTELRGQRSASEIATALGRTRVSVARWLGGETMPRLPQLLELVDALCPRLIDFCGVFADPRQIPSLAEASEHLAQQRRLAVDTPWSHAVLRALELRAYREAPRHAPEVLADAIGLSSADVERLLARLLSAGQVRRTVSGGFAPVQVMTVDIGGYDAAAEQLKRHWGAVALQRFNEDRLGDGLYSYNLCSVSEQDYARIRQLHLRVFNELRAIVAASEAGDRVVLFNQSLVPLDA